MAFTSPIFLFAFLPVVICLHFALRSIPARNAFLLIASVLFYAKGEPYFSLLLVSSAILNAGFGQAMEAYRGRSSIILAAAIAFNVLLNVTR